MVGQALKVGPFIGGLNTASDPTAIGDAELTVCTNFELDEDGSLRSRPPFKESAGHAGWTERIVCLCEAIFGTDHYVIGSNTNGVYHLLDGVWTLITSTVQAYTAVQYADQVYIVPKPGSANPGGKWSPSGGFVAVAAIPQGSAAVILKERLYIAPGISATTNPSRLKFSNASNFEVWTGTDFIDVSQGDGSKLIDLIVYQDGLLLFKNNSTFVLTYDVRPSDGIVREVSPTIGVPKQYCVTSYENQVYLFHGGWVYEIIGNDFHRLNTKVPFLRDPTAPTSFAGEDTFISLLEDRLIVRFLKKIYVYGLRTRTWTEWSSVKDVLHYFGPIITIRPSTGNRYYGGSCLTANKTTIQFFDVIAATTKEETIGPIYSLITCTARSKNFDLAVPHQFKKLFWWGVDVTTNNSVKGTFTPVVVSFAVTWGQLAAYTWGQLAPNTWGQLLTTVPSLVSNISTGTGTARRFIRFTNQVARFRQGNFEVELTTEGSIADGPARIFTYTLITESKQATPRTVN